MSRRRYISTDISTDDRVAQLSVFGQLLYILMIPHAGDDGGITAKPVELRALVVPNLTRRKPSHVMEATAEMVRLELLEECAEEQRFYFPPDAFYKYQRYITANRRKSAQNSANPRAIDEISTSVSVSVPVKEEDPPPKTRARVRPLSAIDEALIAEFQVEFPLANVSFEAEQFRDYCLSGRGKYTDHTAAFRKWARKANEDAKARQSARPANGVYRGGPSPAERARARA